MYIADLHIHSRYSRATSRECVPEYLELWARRKGIHLLGTGDFTHPAWRQELEEKLIPAEEGLYCLREGLRLKGPIFRQGGLEGDISPRFVVSGEVSSIYKKNGRVRKVHNLILLPGLSEAGSHRQHPFRRKANIGPGQPGPFRGYLRGLPPGYFCACPYLDPSFFYVWGLFWV